MALIGFLVNALRGSTAPELGGGGSHGTTVPRKVNLIQLQLGLLSSAKALQDDLRAMAASSDTSKSDRPAAGASGNNPGDAAPADLWVYANVESGEVPFDSAESTFNRLSMSERSKLDAEVTTNVGGQRGAASAAASGDADATSEYIVVTVLVASTARTKLRQADTGEALRETLRIRPDPPPPLN